MLSQKLSENLHMAVFELKFFSPSIWTKQETRQTQSEGLEPPLGFNNFFSILIEREGTVAGINSIKIFYINAIN